MPDVEHLSDLFPPEVFDEEEYERWYTEWNDGRDGWATRFAEAEKVQKEYKAQEAVWKDKHERPLKEIFASHGEGKLLRPEESGSKDAKRDEIIQAIAVDPLANSDENDENDSQHSIPVGTTLRIQRVPTDQIPPSLGTEIWGLHPHATAWTRAPVWALATVYTGMAAAAGAIGYGIYKLVDHIKAARNNKNGRRLHARDWIRETNDH
jgi:hypothetical protein